MSERCARETTADRKPKSLHMRGAVYPPVIDAARGRRPLFDLGLGEILLIGVVILVFVGPDRIPELMSVAGRYYAKLRRLSDDLRRAFNAEVARVEADKRRDELEGRRKEAEAKLAAQRAEREANARAAAEQESPSPGRPMPDGAVSRASNVPRPPDAAVDSPEAQLNTPPPMPDE